MKKDFVLLLSLFLSHGIQGTAPRENYATCDDSLTQGGSESAVGTPVPLVGTPQRAAATPASPSGSLPTYNIPLAYAKAQQLGKQWTKGSVNDKWCTDFINQVMNAGGLPEAPTRWASTQAQWLEDNHWTETRYDRSNPSCEDGSVLWWPVNQVCSSFTSGTGHVAMCFNGKRWQWNPTRVNNGSITWNDGSGTWCDPYVLNYNGPKILKGG